jgi:hypothetical protein
MGLINGGLERSRTYVCAPGDSRCTVVKRCCRCCQCVLQQPERRGIRVLEAAGTVLRHTCTLYSPPDVPPCVAGHCEGALGDSWNDAVECSIVHSSRALRSKLHTTL